jgi:hypothetical protein
MVEAFVPIMLGAITFIISAKLLRVEELDKAFRIVGSKLKRSSK